MEDQTQKKVTVFPTYKDTTNDIQDRQCTYSVTSRRVRVIIVAVEKQ